MKCYDANVPTALSQAVTLLTCIAQFESRLINSCLKIFLNSLGS